MELLNLQISYREKDGKNRWTLYSGITMFREIVERIGTRTVYDATFDVDTRFVSESFPYITSLVFEIVFPQSELVIGTPQPRRVTDIMRTPLSDIYSMRATNRVDSLDAHIGHLKASYSDAIGGVATFSVVDVLNGSSIFPNRVQTALDEVREIFQAG